MLYLPRQVGLWTQVAFIIHVMSHLLLYLSTVKHYNTTALRELKIHQGQNMIWYSNKQMKMAMVGVDSSSIQVHSQPKWVDSRNGYGMMTAP